MKKSYPKPTKFIPRNPQKYVGDVNRIISRSGLELKYFLYVDRNPKIINWCSEEMVINYISPLDNKVHRYFVDMYIKYIDKNGNVRKYLVEIKPLSQTKMPRKGNKKERVYLKECMDYARNLAKWDACVKWCNSKGMEFLIWTENTALTFDEVKIIIENYKRVR